MRDPGSAGLRVAKGRLPSPHTGPAPASRRSSPRWWAPIRVLRLGRVTSMAARPPRTRSSAATSSLPSAAASDVASTSGQRSGYPGPAPPPRLHGYGPAVLALPLPLLYPAGGPNNPPPLFPRPRPPALPQPVS